MKELYSSMVIVAEPVPHPSVMGNPFIVSINAKVVHIGNVEVVHIGNVEVVHIGNVEVVRIGNMKGCCIGNTKGRSVERPYRNFIAGQESQDRFLSNRKS